MGESTTRKGARGGKYSGETMLKYVRYIAAQLILRREEKMRNLERKYGDMISKRILKPTRSI